MKKEKSIAVIGAGAAGFFAALSVKYHHPNYKVWLFENLIQLVNIIGSVFYGTILGIFLVAIFIKKVKGKAVFWAALISEVIIIIIFSKDIVSFLWLNLIGTILTICLGLIIQKLFYKR